MIETIRTLVEAFGPAGYEDEVRGLIMAQIEDLADEISVDPLGNLIAWRRSGKADATRIMLAAHMDEIGLVVTHVNENGFLRFTQIGVLYPVTLPGNRVRFANGTIGTIFVDHKYFSRNSVPGTGFRRLFIDVSNGSGKHNIKVGDVAIMQRPLEVRGKRLIAKSMDDRLGCAIQIEVMRQLKKSPNDVAFVFSVQEELGLRGATTAAFGVEPEIGLSIDVSPAGDLPESPDRPVYLGKGPTVKVKDTRMITPPRIIELLENAAQEAGVSVQRQIGVTGATDAAAIQIAREGTLAGGIGIPVRYVHTTSETVDMDDVEGTVKTLVTLLSKPVEV